MNPICKAIIMPNILNSWFVKIPNVKLNPQGDLYRLNMDTVKKAAMLKGGFPIPSKNAESAVFWITASPNVEPGAPGYEDYFVVDSTDAVYDLLANRL